MFPGAGISCLRVSVCPSVRLSQVGVLYTETAKRRIMQTMSHDNLGKTQTGSRPMEAPNAGAVAANWRL